MFENFVTFNEVIKLSKLTYQNLRKINYSNSLLEIICEKEDLTSGNQVYDLIGDLSVVGNSVFSLIEDYTDELEKRIKFVSDIVNCENNYGEFWSKDMRELILLCSFIRIDDLNGVKCMISTGTNLSNVLEISIRFHRLEISKYVLSIYDDNIHALISACREGFLDLVKHIFETNFDFDIHIWNETPLILAVKNNKFHVVKYLIKKGANPYARNNYVLRKAIDENNYDFVEFLIKSNIKITSDEFLLSSVRMRSWDISKLLIICKGIQDIKYKLLNISVRVKFDRMTFFLLNEVIEPSRNKIRKLYSLAKKYNSQITISFLKSKYPYMFL